MEELDKTPILTIPSRPFLETTFITERLRYPSKISLFLGVINELVRVDLEIR